MATELHDQRHPQSSQSTVIDWECEMHELSSWISLHPNADEPVLDDMEVLLGCVEASVGYDRDPEAYHSLAGVDVYWAQRAQQMLNPPVAVSQPQPKRGLWDRIVIFFGGHFD